MKISQLGDFDDNAVIVADLVIIGGGPVGLTIAAQCARPGIKVLVLESGLEAEDAEHEALNAVEWAGRSPSPAERAMRKRFHGAQAPLWSDDRQPYGVRCRGLGGSTQAWAGKSARFDPIDFASRPWVTDSGWPVSFEELAPYLLRAQQVLNLCPEEPPGKFCEAGLQSYYWQFARSRVDRLDIMRFGRELVAQKPDHVDILLDATVTRLHLDPAGTGIAHLDLASISGKRARVEARQIVLAASGIENARLLLASGEGDGVGGGIGNRHDVVGRFMIDHVGARIGSVPFDHVARAARIFGFYGMHYAGRSHMFMHGLALSPEIQEREGLLNAAIYFSPQRAPDDPWDALKRLLRSRSIDVGRDLASVARGSGLLVKGLGMKILASEGIPRWLKEFIVNSAIRLSPNLVAEEFESQGLPHRLTGLCIEAVCEQAPYRDNRVTLSRERDRFGVRLPRVEWRVGEAERRTLLSLAQSTGSALASAGLPEPLMEDWVKEHRTDGMAAIDMAHTMGTTRMSADARNGVVNANCRVHGLRNLYVAGGSVFPTGGHANPTWMILAFAIRLADHLKSQLWAVKEVPAGGTHVYSNDVDIVANRTTPLRKG